MSKRPLSIAVIAWIFMAAGAVGLAYHATELKAQLPPEYDVLWVLFVRLLAILSGAFLLRGSNWAPWGLVVWLAYHVILSVLHSPVAVIVHSLLLALVTYCLFRPQASAYIRGAKTTEQPWS